MIHSIRSSLLALASPLAILAVWAGASSSATAQSTLEITWSSSLLDQRMILSDGLSLESGTSDPVIMEIGSFGSFIPTAENMHEWMDHWKIFDAITPGDSDSSDAFSTNSLDDTYGRYSGGAELTGGQLSTSEDAAFHNPDATFSGNEQAYVFMRTSDDYAGGSQWLLFTSSGDSDGTGLGDAIWQFPDTGDGAPDFSQVWTLDQADTAIVGAINGGSTNGGDTGAGSFTDSSTNFALRLHAVPEPESALLILISTVAVARRRRHHL